jgi:hypothetical protein
MKRANILMFVLLTSVSAACVDITNVTAPEPVETTDSTSATLVLPRFNPSVWNVLHDESGFQISLEFNAPGIVNPCDDLEYTTEGPAVQLERATCEPVYDTYTGEPYWLIWITFQSRQVGSSLVVVTPKSNRVGKTTLRVNVFMPGQKG